MTKHESVQELFSRAAEKFRNETAIIQSDQTITYGELEDRSNSLANFLISKGFIKGGVVSILADRATAMITAIIATLKIKLWPEIWPSGYLKGCLPKIVWR